MSLKKCLKAGINLSDEDTSAVLSGYDTYARSMSQDEAVSLAINDALESVKFERNDTLAEIHLMYPQLGSPKFNPEQMNLIFDIHDDTVMAPLDEIRGNDTAPPEETIETANIRIEETTRGEGTKRQPLTAWEITREDGSKYYDLRDGNTTLQILKDNGFTEAPLTVERSIPESERTDVGEHGSTRENIPLNELGTMTKRETDFIADEMKEDQKGWGFEETYAKATENQQYLNKVGEAIGRMVEAEYVAMPPVEGESVAGEKTRDSARDKIGTAATATKKATGKYKGDASQMTDIVRGTLKVSHPDDVPKIVKQLGKRFKGVDEGYRVNDSNYFDRKVLVQFDNGQVGEVQIVAPKVYWFKEKGGGHATYKAMEKEWMERNPETGKMEPIKGYEYIAMTAFNTMKAQYARNIGSESDAAWLDIYEKTMRAQLDPALADDAVAIAEKAAEVKDQNPLVTDETGMPPPEGLQLMATYLKNAAPFTTINEKGEKVKGWSVAINPQPNAFTMKSPQPSKQPKRSLSSVDVRQFITDKLAEQPRLGKIHFNIFDTQDEAFGPNSVERHGVIEAGYYVGTNEMVVISENIKNVRHLGRVIRHETVGHFGFREIFNKEGEYDRLLSRVWKARNGEMKKEALWVDKNYPALSNRVEVEGRLSDAILEYADEMVARASETRTEEVGLWKSIVDFIRKWLNKYGLTVGPISMEELKSLIRVSNANLHKKMLQKYSNIPAMGAENAFRTRSEFNEYMQAIEDGLDMSQKARWGRAQEQGFKLDRVWYHGTSRYQSNDPADPYRGVPVNDFDAEKEDFRAFELDFKGIGRNFMMVSPSPTFAQQFAGLGTLEWPVKISDAHTGGSRIIPLLVKTKKTFDFENVSDKSLASLEKFAMAEYQKSFVERRYAPEPEVVLNRHVGTFMSGIKEGAWSQTESKIMQGWLQENGYDSFYAMEGMGMGTGGAVKNLAVMNPNQLRSVNAAFNPDYMDADALLARRASDSAPQETDIAKGSKMDTYRKAQEKRPIVGQVMEPIRNKSGEYRRNANQDITGAPDGVKTDEQVETIVQEIVAYIEDPAAQMPYSAEWYNVSGAAIREISHGDPAVAERVVRIAAVLSAANQVGGNTTGFIKAIYQIARGDELAAGRFPNEFREAMPQILAAKDMNFHLPKVEAKVMSFYRNLWDATFQSDKYEGSVTMDMWMARLYGYRGDTFGAAQYRFASMATKRVAEAYNAKHDTSLTPDQVQAALWVYQRNTDNLANDGTPIPEAGDRSAFDTYIDRALQKVVFEAVPSKDSGLFPELHDLPFDVKDDYTRQAISLILNEGGENELFNRIGIPLYTSTPSEGSFLGDVSPNEIMSGVSRKIDVLGKEPKFTEQVENRTAKKKLGPFPAKNKRTRVAGPPEAKTIPSTEEIGLAARAIAYIYSQDGVPVFQFDPTLTGGRRGVSIRFASTPTLEMQEGLLAHVGEKVNTDFTRVGNDMFFMNLRDEDGFFSGMKDKEFIAAVAERANSYTGVGSELFTEAEIKTDVKATSTYLETDWKDEAAAREGLEDFFRESGRSDLLPFLRDRREAVGQLQAAFSKDVAPPFDPTKMAARRADPTKTQEFRAWAGTDEIIDQYSVNDHEFKGDGPWVMRLWHGTTHDIESFEANQFGRFGSQFGKTSYFTSEYNDATINYGGTGPDLTFKIRERQDEIVDSAQFDDDIDDISYEDARKQAESELKGGDTQVLPLYVKTENPFVVRQASSAPSFGNQPNRHDVQSPFVEIVETEGVEEEALERVAYAQDISVDEVKKNIKAYEDEIWDARYEILSEKPNKLINAIDAVASARGLDTSDLLQGAWDYGITDEDAVRTSAIENFMRFDDNFMEAQDWDTGEMVGPQIIAEVIQEMGYDSIVLQNAENRFVGMEMDKGTAHVMVFDENNTNVKHAHENSGAFDPNDPRIRFSRQAQEASDAPVGVGLGLPEESWKDKFVRLAQDNFNRVKKIQETLVEGGGIVTNESDIYRAEELSSSKIASRIKQLGRNYIDPLLKILDANKITVAQLDQFLIARHALERNEYIASINPDMQDGGSGMLTDDADAILESLEENREAYEEAADLIYAMNNEKMDSLVEGGHMDQEQVDGLRDRWQYYVPLKGKKGEENRAGLGQGFSVGSKVQRAMGRGAGNMPESPTAHALADAETAVVRTEKTKVGMALVELVRNNPDPNFWTITESNYKKFEDMFGQAFEGFDEAPVGMVENTDYHRVFSTTKAERDAATAEGRPPKPIVRYAIDRNYRKRDDVFTVMHGGKELLVTIKDDLMMEQLKKMNTTQLNAVVAGFGKVNRYLAMVNTALNPEFVITNFERDFQTAMINLGGEHSAGIAARVAKGIPSAIRGIWQSTFDTKGKSPWRALFDEMEAEGGTIGFFGLEDIDTKVKKLQKKLDNRHGVFGATMTGIATLRDAVLDANLSVENAARLSAYKVVKEEAIANGMSEKDAKIEAASVAKNLTVNFNRKGELAPVFNSAYLFYNATIQGSARIFKALRSPRVRKILGGVVATSVALALYNRGAGGDDDDGLAKWDKMTPFNKQSKLIIMKPDGSGEYWSAKLPYGYNVFWYAGVIIDSLINDPNTSVPKETMNMLTAVVNAYNPINGADLLDTLTPTFLKPYEQDARNVNFMGGNVKPEFPFDNYDRPESEKSFKSTNPQLKEIMIAINEMTGGDSTHSGLIDISPEIVKHYVQWVTGGAGQTVSRAVGTATNLAQGEPIDQRNVPLYRTLGGEVGSRYDTERFYSAVESVNAVEAGLKLRLGTNDWKDYQKEHHKVHVLSLRMKGTKKLIKSLREARDRAYAADDREKADMIREQMRQRMMEFSALYDDARAEDDE